MYNFARYFHFCKQSMPIMHTPLVTHSAVVKHILRYLKGTSMVGLFFSKSANQNPNAFSDVD